MAFKVLKVYDKQVKVVFNGFPARNIISLMHSTSSLIPHIRMTTLIHDAQRT